MNFTIPLLLAATLLGHAAETAAARWEGTVQIPGRDVTVVIDLAQDAHGSWVGSAIIPGFDIKGAPLSEIAVEDDAVSFALNGVLGDPKFKGRLANGAITGDYEQAGNSAPFTLHKAGSAQVDRPRKSTPVRKEFEGEWKGGFDQLGTTVHVTVTLTNQAGGPAVAKFHVVGRRDRILPVDLVIEDGDFLILELRENGITYEGRFRKDLNEFAGTFLQRPYEAPLTLHHSAGVKP